VDRLQDEAEEGADKAEKTAEEATEEDLDLDEETVDDETKAGKEAVESDLEVNAEDEEEVDQETTDETETLAEEVEGNVDLDEQVNDELDNHVNFDNLQANEDLGLDSSDLDVDESSDLNGIVLDMAAVATRLADFGILLVAVVDVNVQCNQEGDDVLLGRRSIAAGDELGTLNVGGGGNSHGSGSSDGGGGDEASEDGGGGSEDGEELHFACWGWCSSRIESLKAKCLKVNEER